MKLSIKSGHDIASIGNNFINSPLRLALWLRGTLAFFFSEMLLASVRTDPALAHAAPPTSPSLCSREGPSPLPHRPRRARRSLARSRTRASRRGRASSAYPCPCHCRGPCHQWAPHRQPPRHSVFLSSAPASNSTSTGLHSSKQILR